MAGVFVIRLFDGIRPAESAADGPAKDPANDEAQNVDCHVNQGMKIGHAVGAVEGKLANDPVGDGGAHVNRDHEGYGDGRDNGDQIAHVSTFLSIKCGACIGQAIGQGSVPETQTEG